MTHRSGHSDSKTLTFIDLFAGCGGLSLGLMQAGWKGLFAIEKSEDAFATLKANLLDNRKRKYAFEWPDWLPATARPLSSLLKSYSVELRKLRGRVDLIAGGPPCQGFSFAGKRDGTDARNRLVHQYLRVVRLVRPKFILIENVGGIAVRFDSEDGKAKRLTRSYADIISASLRRHGYVVSVRVLKAAEFGVPQLRPRYIFIGIRRDLPASQRSLDPFEVVSAARPDFLKSKGLSISEPTTVGDAISDLEVKTVGTEQSIDTPGFLQIQYKRPRTQLQKLLHGDMNGVSPNSLRLARHTPQIQARFQAMLDACETNKCRKGVSLSPAEKAQFGIRKHTLVILDADRTSHTLTTLPDDFIHYSEPRILTVRECARLQTFPDWFEFHGKYTTGGNRRRVEAPRYTQVGNAVPPFLAEALGKALKRIALNKLNGKTRSSTSRLSIQIPLSLR